MSADSRYVSPHKGTHTATFYTMNVLMQWRSYKEGLIKRTVRLVGQASKNIVHFMSQQRKACSLCLYLSALTYTGYSTQTGPHTGVCNMV